MSCQVLVGLLDGLMVVIEVEEDRGGSRDVLTTKVQLEVPFQALGFGSPKMVMMAFSRQMKVL